ncbi:flavin-dependent dehydrogenase [Prauserella muralis]|nr:flavin-dependent dehydrogenase [Prauserella muralis]
MAGLLAAAALAPSFGHVAVVERDKLDEAKKPTPTSRRRGVPQAAHVHAFQPRGLQELEFLLPGARAELRARGAHLVEPGFDQRIELNGNLLAPTRTRLESVQATRGLFEDHIRSRVRELPNVTLLDDTNAAGLVLNAHDSQVTGVRVAGRTPGAAATELPAELVVDAMGRGSRLPAWLAAYGLGTAEVESHRVDVTYSTALVTLRDLPRATSCLIVGPGPGRPAGLGLMAVEGDAHVLTVAGIAGHKPPRSFDELVEAARSLLPDDFAGSLDGIERHPAADVATFSYPKVEWRRLDRLAHKPAGLLAIGDSLCAFNPIYAQGMTVAVLQARALADAVATPGRRRIEARYFAATRPLVKTAWSIARAADLAVPELPGRRSPAMRLLNRYVSRVQAGAATDPRLASSFIRVVGMIDPPPALLSPATVARALRPRPRASGSSHGRPAPSNGQRSHDAHA